MIMKAEDIKTVSVIGAGLMGHGIAQVFASKGHIVYLIDLEEQILRKAIDNIRSNLSAIGEKGGMSGEEIESTIDRIRTTTSLNEAVASSQMIIEVIPEDLELKQGMFQDLDRLCHPEAILATNTSVISVTEIAATSRRKERILGTHFWFPPYIIPLVEVVKGNETSAEAVETTYHFLKTVGKYPVKVNKDVPGFVGNRLQHALWREAISIVEHGIADPATVDDVIKKGFGIRLPVLGPLENADMIGLDLTLAIHSYILKHIEASPEPSPLLEAKARSGELGFKTGRGFRTWSLKEIEDSRHNLSEYLLHWAQEQQNK